MDRITIDRRRLLKLGLSSGVVAVLPLACVPLGRDDSAFLLEVVGSGEAPLRPDATGVLSDGEFDVLAGLVRYVDRVWEFEADMQPYLDRLQADLRFKTEQTPSYLTEYRGAIELFGAVSERGDADETWATLLFGDFEHPEFESTRLGRARAFVFSELITHQIPMSGAFKSLGLWNYRGYFGGAYTSPESYRRGEV